MIRYLKGTIHLRLIYGAKTKALIAPSLFRLIKYGNKSYIGDFGDTKSVMRYCYFIHGAIVFQCSKKQRTVSTSIIEANYIALGHTTQKDIWLRRFINELQVNNPIYSITLHRDNKISITLTKNTKSQNYTKYIDMQYHYIHKLIEDGKLEVK